ncbi:ATP-grasp domain-containing protein [bacterium]|nr:ATP-grasp domain-containing protein [bacterium]
MPRLAAIGVPQASTRFVPLPEITGAITEDQARELLEKKLSGFDVAEWGVFVRTYYGTLKRNPMLHLAHSRAQLVSRATHLVSFLSDHQEIGGLAVRERLPIKMIATESGRITGLELRVFIGFGKPLFWSCHLDLESARADLSEKDLASLGALSSEQHETMRSLSERVAGALQGKFLVADFALLEDGRVSLVEVNPGHSSGWGHEAALIGAFGRFLRQVAGLPDVSVSELEEIAGSRGIDLWGRGTVIGFYG